MNYKFKVVAIDNKFDTPTAHIAATRTMGFLATTIMLFSGVTESTKVGDVHEFTAEEFKALNIVKKESTANPGQYYNKLV